MSENDANNVAKKVLNDHFRYRVECLKRITDLAIELSGKNKTKMVIFGKSCFELVWVMLLTQFGRETAINTLCEMISGIAQASDDIEEVIARIKSGGE